MSDATPRPWHWEVVGYNEYLVGGEDDLPILCHEVGREIAPANKALIAAAPTLLAACEEVIRRSSPSGRDWDIVPMWVIDQVREAVANAHSREVFQAALRKEQEEK